MKHTTHVGVIIGRFQVPELHDGHHHLVRHARERHEQLLIMVGSRQSFPTPKNPLSFTMRRAMILAHYPDAVIVEVHDHPSDHEWSMRVDRIIAALYPGMSATLYGSRDSFLPYYSGKNVTVEVSTIPSKSGSELRDWIKENPLNTSEFRHGVIHAHAVRAAMPYPTVDIAVVKREKNAVLLGHKPMDGDQYRFLGGFYDPACDTSLESAARRETYEETGGIEADDFTYVGSHRVDDWRYRGGEDCIVTTLFKASYIFGAPHASDDIAALGWFDLSLIPQVLVPEHKPLGEMLLNSLINHKESS
jgi:bifunctional NMN adenylyltransferase/nudix hydrolase